MPRLPRKVQLLPRKVQLHVAKCCACHSKCSYMSPSATPVTQKATAPTVTPENQARYQSQPSATSATPDTQSAATCRQVPPTQKAAAPRRHLRTKRATRASPMPYVPRLPRKVEVDVSKYHACHAQRRWMSQRATPATPTAAVKLCEDDKWCQLKTSCVWRTSYVCLFPILSLLRTACQSFRKCHVKCASFVDVIRYHCCLSS